jgi:hypothetical protein
VIAPSRFYYFLVLPSYVYPLSATRKIDPFGKNSVMGRFRVFSIITNFLIACVRPFFHFGGFESAPIAAGLAHAAIA